MTILLQQCNVRPLLLLFVVTFLARAESITGTRINPGGSPSLVGVVTVDGNQSFGSQTSTFHTSIFPGIHTISSSSPSGYVVFYSVCVNCVTHLAATYVTGTSLLLAVPIGGTVDISFLYVPQTGVIQGSRVLSDGTAFTNAALTLDSLLTLPAGASVFTSSASADSHSLVSATPAGYSVSYSICSNCTQHPSASFVIGSSATVQVPPSGFIDVQFQYTAIPGAPPVTTLIPALNQTVAGNITFSVTGPSLLKTASVEYTLGAYRIAMVGAQSSNPNFQFTWNSALASDGNSQIEVTARDYLDNIIFQDIRPITLSNYGNSASALLAPTVAGMVPVALSAYDKFHFPAYWQIFLDGEILPTTTGLLFSDHDGVHSNSRNTVIDTTLYPNGRHEFHFAFHSNDYPSASSANSNIDFRGMVTQNVNINNGRALMEILPNYLFVYAPVSTGVQLTCSRAYTNGDHDSCSSPTYSVTAATSSPGIQVSPSGLIIASQEGYGDILVADSGKTAAVHVWIRNTLGLPHFQDYGKTGTTYLAGKSLYVVAPFQLAPTLLISNPQLIADVKRAGVNTLNQGMFQAATDITEPFATWKQNFDNAAYASTYAWSVANGFRILGSGDDIVRRPRF